MTENQRVTLILAVCVAVGVWLAARPGRGVEHGRSAGVAVSAQEAWPPQVTGSRKREPQRDAQASLAQQSRKQPSVWIEPRGTCRKRNSTGTSRRQ